MRIGLPAAVAAACAALLIGAALVAADGSRPGVATAQGSGGFTVTPKQLRINQRISQAAVRRANANRQEIEVLKRQGAAAGAPGPQGPAGPQGPPGEPAVRLFAVLDHNVVTDDVVAIRGSGVVDVTRAAAGVYRVTFDRSIRDCAPVATVWNSANATDTIRTAQVSERGAAPNEVTVRLRDRTTGGLSDGDASLAVLC
jgi:hypothetical protein